MLKIQSPMIGFCQWLDNNANSNNIQMFYVLLQKEILPHVQQMYDLVLSNERNQKSGLRNTLEQNKK